ncbi:MAG: SPFH domain-containing protein [Eggerthellaceae bacterium]|nr:SPFH domain-containing protein [Eggerthellaceae bacterium]
MPFITDALSTIGTIFSVIFAIIAIIIIIRVCYKKVPPNQAYIISGFHKRPKIVSGRATMTIPMIQRIDRLNLGLIQSNIVTSAPVPTADFIEVSVSAVVNFQISADLEQLERATRNFLNFSKEDISRLASEVLEGSMREIIGQMFIKDMVTDRETFNTRVIQTAKPDLNNMGLDLISFNVQNFQDERGVIEKLGMDQTAQITRDAAIAKIEADREVELKSADARNVTNDRNTQTNLAIAQREQQLAVTRAKLQIEQDTKKAEADLAYQIQTETKSRELEIAKQEASIARQEKEIEIKERQVQITERELEAQVKKRAEADRYAKQEAAEASLFEIRKRSEAEKAQADAERYKIEANAQAQEALGKAEASVIEAKGQAGARSTELQGLAVANALKEQAEAYNSMLNPYVLLEKYIQALPLIAAAIAEPLGRIGNITMYGDGNVANLVEETTRTTTQLNAALSDSLGFDMQGMLNGMITGRAIGNGIKGSAVEPHPIEGTAVLSERVQKPMSQPAVKKEKASRPQNRTASGAGISADKDDAEDDIVGRTFANQPDYSQIAASNAAAALAAAEASARAWAAQQQAAALVQDQAAQPVNAHVEPGKTDEKDPKYQAIVEAMEVAEELEQRFEKDLIGSSGAENEKLVLANSITQAYARSKKLVFDPPTANRVRNAVLQSLNDVDLSTLRSKQDVATFVKRKLVPRLLDA